MAQLKLKDLYQACKQLMKEGHGEKFLVVSNDNEGNGFHGLYWTFSAFGDNVGDGIWPMIDDCVEDDPENILILG